MNHPQTQSVTIQESSLKRRNQRFMSPIEKLFYWHGDAPAAVTMLQLKSQKAFVICISWSLNWSWRITSWITSRAPSSGESRVHLSSSRKNFDIASLSSQPRALRLITFKFSIYVDDKQGVQRRSGKIASQTASRNEFIIDSMLTGFAVFVRSGFLFIFVPVVVHVAL